MKDILTFNAIGECTDEFSEEGVLSTGIPYIDRSAILFHVGNHKGRDWKHADLDKQVNSFKAPKGETDWSVPIQIDHTESARDTCGNVRSLKRDGDRNLGVLRFSGADNVNSVKAGNFLKVSVGLRKNGSLHHVAVTPFPYLDEAHLFDEASESEDPTVATTTAAAAATTAATNGATQTFKSVETLEAEFAQRTKAQEDRMAAMEARLKQQDEVIRFTEISSRIEKFSESGKTSPDMRPAELELLKTFSDEQLALYETLKEKQPAVVDFSVRGSAHQTPPPAEAKEAAKSESERMAKLSKRNGAK